MMEKVKKEQLRMGGSSRTNAPHKDGSKCNLFNRMSLKFFFFFSENERSV